MTAPAWAALVALLPLALLGWLVLATHVRLALAATLSTVAALGLAVWPFRLEVAGLASGVGKGLWTGGWILLIVVPALLLYEVTEHSGALSRLGEGLAELAPTPGRRLLLLGWVLPSFLQGAAGFGTPIAIAAPMLVRLGTPPVVAVSTCLLGYHWAVTFGSMGSSFFVAVGTTGLGPAETIAFAFRVGFLLAINAAAAGLIVLQREERRPGDVRTVMVTATAMAVALLGTVAIQPALGSTVAGLTGMAVAVALFRRSGRVVDGRQLLQAAAPYLALTALVTLAFGVPPIREIVGRVPELAPSFPRTQAAFGHVTEAVGAHNPLKPLLHPGPYLVLAAGVGVAIERRRGRWRAGSSREVLSAWTRRSRGVLVSIPALTVLAGLMVEAGMVTALAHALTATLDVVYVPLAPVVGMLGTVMTGSTTASNALLAPLQAEAARSLELSVPLLLAAQAAGGNVGNILSPVNILVGAVAAGCAGQEGDVIRRSWQGAAILLALVILGVVVQTLL